MLKRLMYSKDKSTYTFPEKYTRWQNKGDLTVNSGYQMIGKCSSGISFEKLF